MPVFSLSVSGEARASVLSDRAVITANILVTKDDAKAAYTSALSLAIDLKKVILDCEIPIKATTETELKKDNSKAKVQDNPINQTSTADDEYEIVSPSQQRARCVPIGTCDQLEENSKSLPSHVLSPTKHHTKSTLSVRARMPFNLLPKQSCYCCNTHPCLHVVPGSEPAEDRNRKSNHEIFDAQMSFYIELDNAFDHLEGLVQRINSIGKGCYVSKVTCRLSSETLRKTQSTLRREAIRDALEQVRDHCYGLSCKLEDTTIEPTSIRPSQEPRPNYFYDPIFGPPAYNQLGDVEHEACAGQWLDLSPCMITQRLRLNAKFDVRTTSIYMEEEGPLTMNLKPTKAKPKKKEPRTPIYVPSVDEITDAGF